MRNLDVEKGLVPGIFRNAYIELLYHVNPIHFISLHLQETIIAQP